MNDEQPRATEHNESRDARLLGLLRVGAFLCFGSWTWVHYYWEAPYGALLWQNTTYELASRVGVDWDQFVGTGANDGFVQKWITRLWWPYLGFTILTLTVRKRSRIQMARLCLGSAMLALLSYAKYVTAQHQLPMLVEHGGQVLMPIVLVIGLVFGVRHHITISTTIVAVLATFLGHGSYACGFWPTPNSFYAMTTVILRTNYETTRSILYTAGVLDFLVCVGLFVPMLRRLSACYAAIWGFLTALARPVAGMSTDLNYFGADQYLHEMILRAPHFVLPLYLFLVWRTPRDEV